MSTRSRWTAGRIVLALIGFAGLAAGSAFGYFQLVKAGVLKYNKYDRRDRGDLSVGDTAPDLELTAYEGSPVRLSELWATKPVFLVFGSCT